MRLGDATDRDLIHSLLCDEPAWASAFDVPRVRRLWDASTAGTTDARQERVLRAAVWRGAFTDHLAGLQVVGTVDARVGAEVAGVAEVAGANRVDRPPRPLVPWARPLDSGSGTGGQTDSGSDSPAQESVLGQGAAVAKVVGSVQAREPVLRMLARAAVRTAVWESLRDTRAGRVVRSGADAARRRGVRL